MRIVGIEVPSASPFLDFLDLSRRKMWCRKSKAEIWGLRRERSGWGNTSSSKKCSLRRALSGNCKLASSLMSFVCLLRLSAGVLAFSPESAGLDSSLQRGTDSWRPSWERLPVWILVRPVTPHPSVLLSDYSCAPLHWAQTTTSGSTHSVRPWLPQVPTHFPLLIQQKSHVGLRWSVSSVVFHCTRQGCHWVPAPLSWAPLLFF